MAARATGSATISFGLVAIPIKFYTAAAAEGVRFNMLHKTCGGRLKQQMICPVCDLVVERADTLKGYEYGKNQYVKFTEEEVKALEAERSDSLEILEFVPADSVDFVYIEKSYYIGPDKGGHKPYRLLSETMLRNKRIAVGRHSTRGKEQLVLLRPYKGGLILHQVYYANEVRSFDDVDTGGAQVFKPGEENLADRLLDALATDAFRPEIYKDDYVERVQKAVEQKVAGQELTAAPERAIAQIVDIFEALKMSLKEAPAVLAANERKAKPLAKTGVKEAATQAAKTRVKKKAAS